MENMDYDKAMKKIVDDHFSEKFRKNKAVMNQCSVPYSFDDFLKEEGIFKRTPNE